MKNKITVYLVDDDIDDRMFTREALESVLEGVSVEEFSDGIELLRALHETERASEPALIMLDINLPMINGLDLLSAIKRKPTLCHIPVVLLSTSSDSETIKKAYQTGVNAYFIKPVSVFEYKKIAHVAVSCFVNAKRSLLIPNKLASQKATNILVIEDNADHWDLMQLAMARLENVRFFHRESAEATLEFLESSFADPARRIDLVILDLYLPGRQHGLDLIEAIRALFIQQMMAPVPILVFSASDHHDDIKASYQRRANAYITKSYDVKQSAFYLNDLCNLWATTIAMPKVAPGV